WVDSDPAWHMLFTIAETSSGALQRVEPAIRHWSDGARVMPKSWWAAIQDGDYATHHQLVRQLVLKGDEAAILLRKGVRDSLGGLAGLGLDGIDLELLTEILDLDWLANVVELRLIDSRVPAKLATTDAFPGVRRLVLRHCTATAKAIADLLVGS